MPIDEPQYPTQFPASVNPFALVQGYASAAHTLGENQLQQQEIRGRQALGNIVARNTDPQTGQLNYPKALGDISQDPNAKLFYLKTQHEMQSANPPTNYLGTNSAGQPTPAKAPLFQVPGIYSAPQGNPLTNGRSAPGPQQNPPTNSASTPNGPVGPPMSQEKIDQAHTHNQTIIKALEPLANDPQLDHKKVIRTVSDLVANPDVHFSAIDGASALSSLPFGPNGEPPSPDAIREKIAPILEQQKQNEAALNEHYPSSNQLRAKQVATTLSGGGPPQTDASPQGATTLTTPGVATDLPAGYAINQAGRQTHYQQVLDSANTAETENAALNNIYNLSKDGNAPTGTALGKFYSYLAERNLAPAGAQTSAEQLQLIHSHAAQIANAAGSRSDQDQLAHQLATSNIDDFPKVIQTMVPYLKAINSSKIAQAGYYHGADPTGADPNKISQAQLNWQQNADPRIFELKELQSDPAALKEYTSGLAKADRDQLITKYRHAKQLGLLGQ